MSILQAFKRALRKLTPTEVAAAELAEAELARLQSQTGQEYAQAMCDYHGRRIARLRAFLAAQAKEAP